MKHYDNDMKIFSCMLYLQMLICGSLNKKTDNIKNDICISINEGALNKYIC